MVGKVQEIRKKFEKLSNISSDDTGLNHGIYKQKVYSKQYKSLTALNLKEDEQNEQNLMAVEESDYNENFETDQEIITSGATGGQRNEILNINNTKIYNMESESNNNNEIENDENYQNIDYFYNPDTNTNDTVEKEEEEADIFPIEIKLRREKNRAFKSKTQLEERKKIHDDSKYYSHPNRIAEKRNSSIDTYQNVQVNRDSSTSILEHIVDELVKTEETFVSKLRLGYENYKTVFERDQPYMPKGLIGKKYVLFRTVEEILDFHENEMLPMLQTNQYDLNTLCLSFSKFIEEHKFYPHLLYIMHKRRAETLCKHYKEFFDDKAKQLNDNLGIMSLLIQPLHRVTKYPLLFHQIMKDCFKNYDMKPVLQLCCKTEKKMCDYVKLINESERVGNIIDIKENINLYEQGRLKKVDKFYVYDSNLQKRFKSRVFLFEKSIIYTEISTKLNSETIKFRGVYPCDKLSIYLRDPGFTLYREKPNIQDCDLEAKTEDIKNSWIKIIKNIVVTSAKIKHIQSLNTNHITPYSHLFRYRFLNRTDSIDSLASTSSASISSNNRNSDRNSIISTGSFHNY